MAEKASNAALAAFAQDRSAALMKAAATGDMDVFAREYNAIPDGWHHAQRREPEDRKVRRGDVSTRTATSERRQADSRLCAALTIRTRRLECLRPAPGTRRPSRNG